MPLCLRMLRTAPEAYTVRAAAPPVARVEALRQEIVSAPMPQGDGVVILDFSAGIAGTPANLEATTPRALLSAADTRLLAAKRAGRGRCVGSEVLTG